MHMLYNSDSFTVVAVDIPARPRRRRDRAPSAARRLRDRRQVRAQGHLHRGRRGRGFKAGVEALMAATRPSEEDIDDYIGGFTALMQQPLVAALSRPPPLKFARAPRRLEKHGARDATRLDRAAVARREVHDGRARSSSGAGAGDAGALDAPARPGDQLRWRAYVALELARRVRVLRTAAGVLWLLGAASAMAHRHLVEPDHRHRRRVRAFAIGYHGLGTLGVWAAGLGRRAWPALGAGLRPRRDAGPRRLRRRCRSASALVGIHALALAAARPCARASMAARCRWSPRSRGAAGGCMMALGAFFLRRRSHRGRRARLAGGRRPRLRRQPGRRASNSSSAPPAIGRPDRLGPRRRLTSTTLPALPRSARSRSCSSACCSRSLEAHLRLSLRRAETELQRSAPSATA